MDNSSRLWSLQDLATYLHVAEKTVSRMIQRGDLPAVRVGNQWRIVPSEVTEWIARQRSRPESLRDMLRSDPMAVPFDRLIRGEHILYAPEIRDEPTVLKRLAAMVADAYPEVDADEYRLALEEREQLMSTSLGGGVAVPHIRHIDRNPPDSLDPFLLITGENVSFGGSPCRIFCLICTDDLVLHLRMIQKITYILRRDDVIEELTRQHDVDGILRAIVRAERTLSYEES